MMREVGLMNVIRVRFADLRRGIYYAYAYKIRNDSYLYLFVLLSRSSIQKSRRGRRMLGTKRNLRRRTLKLMIGQSYDINIAAGTFGHLLPLRHASSQ